VAVLRPHISIVVVDGGGALDEAVGETAGTGSAAVLVVAVLRPHISIVVVDGGGALDEAVGETAGTGSAA
jgi:hypothetical protein